MAYTKNHSPINWANYPSTATPINETNLNKMDTEIGVNDSRIVELDENKVDKVAGKGLSTNDYDNTAKGIVDGVTSALADKVDKVEGKGLSTNDYDNTAKGIVDGVTSALAGKVDKVAGKGLSTEDFTTTEKTKLAGISAQANKVEITPVVTEGTTLAMISIDGVDTAIKGSDIDVDDEMSPTSENPVQNKVIYDTLQSILPEETAEGNPISITDASGLSAKSCEVSFSPIQSGSGDPSPENVRPISGRNGLFLTQAGKNLLAKPFVYDNNIDYNLNNYFFVKAGSYRFSFNMETTNWRIVLRMKDKNGNDLSSSENQPSNLLSWSSTRHGWMNGSNVTVNNYNLTIATDCYIRLLFASGSTSSSTVVSNAQLELGSSKTNYEAPVTPTTHTATFPDTVYGGKVVWKDGIVKAIIDRAIIDLGSLTWEKSTQSTYTVFSNTLKIENKTRNDVCESYKAVNSSRVNLNNNEIGTWNTSTSIGFFAIRDDSKSSLTAEDFKTAMNGIHTTYFLETPQEITLTAEQIELLKGANVLWTDGDSVKLVYSADIKSYIAEQLAQLS